MFSFNFTPPENPSALTMLRQQVRDFLATALSDISAVARAHTWTGTDCEFSKKLGQQGWIGMQWPTCYGGGERDPHERYVVIEELLASGAPVGAHWIADRQSGTLLLRYADEEIKQKYLPAITRGECYSCIGMSEPDAGSDLAAIKTRARKTDDGWIINGAKLWTTNVDKAHFMIALVRTSDGERHSGLSQILVDLSLPGVTVNPITDQTGESHFGEVFFDDVLVANNCLLGLEGNGWQQVNDELSLERSGPERYLSSYRLLEEYMGALSSNPPDDIVNLIGQQVAELWTLRQMSQAVAGRLRAGMKADIEAAIVKDLGACFEQQMPQRIQSALGPGLDPVQKSRIEKVMNYLLDASPAFSLRGGTREILRGIIARGLGLR